MSFEKATKKKQSKSVKIPKFELQCWEDYFTYFVIILGISEDIFWNCDISSILTIIDNKAAYDGYISYIKEKEYEKAQRRR